MLYINLLQDRIDKKIYIDSIVMYVIIETLGVPKMVKQLLVR